MTGAKRRNLKITKHLRHGKEARRIKEPIWKESKPKAEVAKTELSDFGYRSIRFF
jgi:hypothetical protein